MVLLIKIILYGFGSPLSQNQVVVIRAGLIGMPLNLQINAPVLRYELLDECVERRFRLRSKFEIVTTLRKIVQIVRQAGAKEVHVRVGCPPIRSPCFLGIDMKTREQFIANEKTVPEIAEFITADSLGYLSMRGLMTALKHPRDDVCLGCLTGEYPIAIPGEKMRREKPLEMYAETTSKKAAKRPRSSA